MDNFDIAALYEKTCKRWRTQPKTEERERWQTNLANITEEEAHQAIENHAKGPWKSRMPYAGTIYKEAMRLRKSGPVQSSSLSSGDPFPDKDKDNRRFLETMARFEGRTPEEMEKHINEYMHEWEKKR